MNHSSSRLAVLLAALMAVPLLCGFTGNRGQELEATAGLGLGRVRTLNDNDALGEIGGNLRFKFQHFPYDDVSGWFSVGGSWTTYPTGGDFGNRILTIAVTGGILRAGSDPPLEFGGGFVIFGDYTGFGPAFVLPSLRLRIGHHDRIQFDFGMVDEAPYWTGTHFLHVGVISALPWNKVWAPRLRTGIRINPYSIEHFPFEPYAGVEARIGAHFKIGIDGAIGDGGAQNPPSFSARVYFGTMVGKGTKKGVKPEPSR
ncbi:MAG: hypothetical protein KDA24_14235 [Deltaproteobacteria bacterium]|nr:hypothetical protein [Deltaproteobacteria bacterium]